MDFVFASSLVWEQMGDLDLADQRENRQYYKKSLELYYEEETYLLSRKAK